LASLVSPLANATLEERKKQIELSPIRHYFEYVLVTEGSKDKILDAIIKKLNLPRKQILIVDDRTIRGIQYGSAKGHPTIWLKQGRFANELPNKKTGQPDFIISNLNQIKNLI